MEKTHHVAEYKKKIVGDIVRYAEEYPIIGIVNMENLPAPQLQAMKAKLRGKVNLFMTKKRLIKIALEQAKNNKKNVEELEKYFQGMPALLFTKDSPFKLSKILQRSKSPAPAKAGQISPKDIIIPKGATSFAPGPIISELSSVGIKTGVEAGKVAIKEDSLIVKKGEKIKPKVAEVLTRLGIQPMEVGLDLTAAYENGVIYQKDILLIDEKEFMNKLNNACSGAFNLAVFIAYPAKNTIKTLLGKAFNDAKAIGLSQNIIDEGIIEELLGKAERSMLSLKSIANIDIEEKQKEKDVKEIKEKSKARNEGNKERVKEPKAIIKEEVKIEEKPSEEVEIEGEEPEKEEDIYEEESREELMAEDEVSIAEEGFMEGYEEAGKTKEEVKKEEKLEEVSEEEGMIWEKKNEEQIKSPEDEKERKVPSAHELAKKKTGEKAGEQKEIEDLAKELMKRGTLRGRK